MHRDHRLGDRMEACEVAQRIVAAGDRADDGVLDGQHAAVGDAGRDGRGDIREVAVGKAFRLLAPELLDGLVAERAELTLERDAEGARCGHSRAMAPTSRTVTGPRRSASMPARTLARSPTTTT